MPPTPQCSASWSLLSIRPRQRNSKANRTLADRTEATMTRPKAEVASADQPELLPSPQIRLSGRTHQRQSPQSMATDPQPHQPQVAGVLRFVACRVSLTWPPSSSAVACKSLCRRTLHCTQQRRTRHDLAALAGFRSPAQAPAVRGQHASAARTGRRGLLAADIRTGLSRANRTRAARSAAVIA